MYLAAAQLMWKEDPNLRAAQIARQLTNLPSKFTKHYLPRYAEGTIRKWLKGQGPARRGRPKSTASDANQIDMDSIVEKLVEN